MRRIHRRLLNKRTQTFLEKRQDRVDRGNPVLRAWSSARSTAALQHVFATLVAMVGIRARCYFCGDSRGTDIDHFRPKSRYPDSVFAWPNFLLVCAGCNRKKADQFPLDQQCQPLLIDPTKEDPWDYLYFDPETGQVVARWDLHRDAPDPKGATTTDSSLLPLNIEAVTEGRRRLVRRLVRAVRSYMLDAIESANREKAFHILQRDLLDNDDYGLTHWFFLRDGQHAAPFKALQEQYPQEWQRLQASLDDRAQSSSQKSR